MLMPKRTKFRKVQRNRLRGQATRGTKVSFGDFGIQAVTAGMLTSRQIEAARKAISRRLGKGGKIWIRIFPDHVITMRPADTRMGKGKGAPDRWVARVRPGRVLFEFRGVDEEQAKEAVTAAGHKLPCKARFVSMEQF